MSALQVHLCHLKAVSVALTLGLAALAPLPALAWSHQGHMATGAIAHDTLATRDARTIATIVAIMDAHPDKVRFDGHLAGLSGEARMRKLFQYMARWPDDIRETAYDRPEDHYHGQIVSGATALTFKVGTADAAFARHVATLRDPKTKPADKAVALCWLFHIVGDMHQPLHAGHRLSWRFPFTDRLGTIAWVKRSAGEAPVDFHQLWDAALDLPGADPAGAESIAASLRSVAMRPDQERLAPDGFARLFSESRGLARDLAYAPETLTATRDPAAAPKLSPAYVRRMQGVARFRVAQAGRRLGDFLAQVVR